MGESPSLEHDALLYCGQEEFLAGICGFVEDALSAGQPVLVAVPAGKLDAVRAALGRSASLVEFIDMNYLGRNPARIIPAVRQWITRQGERACRFVGEPLWPGRSQREAAEATRHEALLNLAFADTAVWILCPYDTGGLDCAVLSDARRTHPHLIGASGRVPSACYCDPLQVWDAAAWPLPAPLAPVATVSITDDLASIRQFVSRQARESGLPEARARALVLAVNEAVTNALIHGSEPDRVACWREQGRVICEVTDGGRLDDPLAGRARPEPDCPHGRGLWLINELCDLVELQSTARGTTVRMHVDFEPDAVLVAPAGCRIG